MKRTGTISLMSLSGFLLFVALVCLLHFLRPDKNIRSCFVSEYAVGDFGWLMVTAFYVLALSSTLLLISLLQDGKASVTGCITLGFFSGGILLAGIFPTDLPPAPPTAAGLTHGFAALIALFSLALSMIAWGIVFKKNNRLQALAKPSVVCGLVSLMLLTIFIGSPISVRGLSQRFLLVWDVGWMVWVGWKLYKMQVVVES